MSTKIMGISKCKTQQMKDFLIKNNASPNINCTVDQLVKFYIEEGNIEGVRGDLAFAQAIIETGYFRYGGIVLPSQNNFCGLGALNGNGTGGAATFESPRIGIRAQIQHLKAYATSNSLKLQCVDPRYSLVTKGIAPNIEDLAGKWAVPGYDKKLYSNLEAAFAANATYGQKILGVVSKILEMPVEKQQINVNIKNDTNDLVNNDYVNDNVINDEEIVNDVIEDNSEVYDDYIPQDNTPKQYGQVEASTTGIIAAVLDLLITFFSAWQSVDDEPIIDPINQENDAQIADDDSQDNKNVFSKLKRKSTKYRKKH